MGVKEDIGGSAGIFTLSLSPYSEEAEYLGAPAIFAEGSLKLHWTKSSALCSEEGFLAHGICSIRSSWLPSII